MFTWSIILFFSWFFSLFPAVDSGLHVKISGIKSNKGIIILGIYKDNGSFPTIGKQFKGYELEIKDKKASLHVKDLPKGKYAIGVCHDLNKNKKMDKNLLGFPLEPYGMSNNVRGYLSNPTFKEASFSFEGSLTLDIKVE